MKAKERLQLVETNNSKRPKQDEFWRSVA